MGYPIPFDPVENKTSSKSSSGCKDMYQVNCEVKVTSYGIFQILTYASQFFVKLDISIHRKRVRLVTSFAMQTVWLKCDILHISNMRIVYLEYRGGSAECSLLYKMLTSCTFHIWTLPFQSMQAAKMLPRTARPFLRSEGNE